MYYYDIRPLVGCLLLAFFGMGCAGCVIGMVIMKVWG